MSLATAVVPPAVPHFPESRVRLLPGEVVLKTWIVSRPRRGAGYLHLTDSRLVFIGRMSHPIGSTIVLQEVHLADVNGVTAHIHRGVGMLGVAVIAILGLGAATSAITALVQPGSLPPGISWPVALVWIAAFAYAIWYALTRGSLGLLVHTRTSQHTPIALGGGPTVGLGRLRRSVNRLYTRPTHDVDAVIEEVGARILDIQARGSERMANPVGPWGAP